MDDLIHYFKAKDLLQQRLETTTEEIAIWVWLSPENGILNAYWKYENGSKEKFYFGIERVDHFTDALVDTYFDSNEVVKFKPSERFITYQQVIDAWSKYIDRREAELFLLEKHYAGDITSLHPYYGTAPSDTEEIVNLACYMFIQNQVDNLSDKFFSIPKSGNIKERNKFLQSEAEKIAEVLKSTHPRVTKGIVIHALKQTDERWEKMSVSALERIIKKTW